MNFVTCSPFGELNIKKDFQFGFKPISFKPLYFIKEKWTPFGMFGKKHGIEKRDLDKITPSEEKAVFENRLPEVHEPGPLGPVTFPIQEVQRIPITQSPVGPIWSGQYGPLGIGPVPAHPPPEVVITPPPPKLGPVPGLNTNIARDQLINSYLQDTGPQQSLSPEINSIERPLPPKIEEPVEKEEDNPFIRGSRLAMYFGSLLIDIMSRFLGRPPGPVKE